MQMAGKTKLDAHRVSPAIRVGALSGYVGFILILIFALWGNTYWIERNVLPVGRDAGAHLTRALEYAEILSPLTIQSLFEAVTYHDYRPPGLYLAAQVSYRLLGYTMADAQMVNVWLLAAILGLTFALGRAVLSERTALLATLLTALFPMLAATTRLFYTENFLTAMVLLTLLALLHSQGFSRRPWTILWGLSFGAGMLVKWSLPAYVLLPALIVLRQSNVVKDQLAALRRPRVDLRAFVLAAAGAMALAGLWFFPNRAAAQSLPLGDLLFVVWVTLLTPTLYALARPQRPLTNFWAGAFLGLSLASVWYAARPGFLVPVLDAAYGTYDGKHDPVNLLHLKTYLRYPSLLITSHLGLAGSLLLLPAGLLPWLGRFRAWRSLPVGSLLLWSSVLSTGLFLLFASQDGRRNLIPLLPILAILLADGLLSARFRGARVLTAAAVVVLVVQWALFTFDALGPFHQRTASLWARDEFLVRPASGPTDPRFWIAPDVLRIVQENHDPGDPLPSTLGMLINSPEIHRGPFYYLIRREYPDVDLIPLTERDEQTWIRTVRSHWLLTKDGDNHDVEEPGLRALAQVYQNPDGLLALLFTPVKTYSLPNGETATLWRRSVGPRHLLDAPETLRPLGALLKDWLRHQPLLVSNPAQAYTLGLLDLVPEHVALLSGARPEADTVFTLLHRGEADDPETMAWLEEHYYPAYDGWFDSEYLAIWGRPTGPMTERPVSHHFDDAMLASVTTVGTVTAGNVVPVELGWDQIGDSPLKVSLRLLDAAGENVAQLDRTLEENMRLGLFVPPATAPGRYTLTLSVYDPATLVPLQDSTGNTLISLTTVEIDDQGSSRNERGALIN